MEPSEKRRKVDKECRKFNEEWTTKYFFIECKGKALCLICRETVAILKDLNRHYESKHNASGENLSENNRMKQITALRESLQKQHVMISLTCLSQELVTDAGLVVAYKLAKHKALSDGEFVKECMDATVMIVSPEVEMRLKNVSLSRRTTWCAVMILYQQIWLINWQAKSRNSIIFQFVLMKVQMLWIQRRCLCASGKSTEISM